MSPPKTLDPAVHTVLARSLGRPVEIRSRTPLGGGSICSTERLDTSAGAFVVKSVSAGSTSTLFEAEAQGFDALRASRTSLTIPRVVGWSSEPPAFLVIEHLASARRTADFDERLGRGLAELHRAGASRFGFENDNFCGATPQPNAWQYSWVEFYRDARLGHQVRLTARHGALSATERATLERLIGRLDEWIGEPASGPSLIHGDLWSGNVHVDADGHPALIDPSAYYADREAELGMMTLFGGFSERVFEAYDESFPLDPDWRERNGIYQLYHLLNHLNLFGEGYKESVMSVARRFV